ncbi:MAG: hypothetical protein ACXW3K_05665 [Brevundimonas sp.]
MMTIRKVFAAGAFALAIAAAAPALAQDSSYTPGDYWEVSAIDVEDGQGEAYADYLATRWRASQEFARERGWVKSFYVLQNVNAREGEPDLYLVTVFDAFAPRAEERRREAAFNAWAQANNRELEAQSAGRGTMRKLAGSMLLRQLELRAPR